MKNKKKLLVKLLIGLVLIAVVCVIGYFVIFHNADILEVQEKQIPGAGENWLIASDGEHYYHLGDVQVPDGFAAVNCPDTDDDPLTSCFAFEGQDEKGNTIRLVYVPAASAEAIDLMLYADESNDEPAVQAHTLSQGTSLIYGLATNAQGQYVQVQATVSNPVDAQYWHALADAVLPAFSPADSGEALEVKERHIIDAKKTWLITKDDDRYIKLAEVGAPRNYTSTKDAPDTDDDPLTTFFSYTGKNAEKYPANYLVIPQTQDAPDIGTLAGEGWGTMSIGGKEFFLYPQNLDPAADTTVIGRTASPYEGISIEVQVTLPAPASPEEWISYFEAISVKMEPGKKLSPIAAEFKLNFLDDNRWEGLLNGLGVTMEITFFATLLGIVIGILVAVVRSTWDKNNENMRPGFGKFLMKILNSFCKFYLTIIRGTPVVIQLLLAYYVILINTHDGVLVAILSFGINSGAYVAEIIRAGIQSVDNGQFEAGRSLGFNYVSTMWHIIVPQAFKNVLPSLANEFIVLLKETSVAGYVAVRDLTKEGDLIRGTTFSAFMPLIAVAVIYLIIVMFFTWLVGKLERRLRNSDH